MLLRECQHVTMLKYTLGRLLVDCDYRQSHILPHLGSTLVSRIRAGPLKKKSAPRPRLERHVAAGRRWPETAGCRCGHLSPGAGLSMALAGGSFSTCNSTRVARCTGLISPELRCQLFVIYEADRLGSLGARLCLFMLHPDPCT